MWNSILSVFLSALLILLPISLKAQQTEFSDVSGKAKTMTKGQVAPWTGVLLDNEAVAKILADKKFLGLKYDLKLDMQLQKQQAEHDLSLGLLQSQLDGIQERHVQILNIKSDEINRLQNIVKDRPNSYSEWWFAGGVFAGILVSIGVFFIVTEISEK
tara:strand:+ start:64 stop:537 length:474 start_codon:yes stop_codon:yes gene_type:complete